MTTDDIDARQLAAAPGVEAALDDLSMEFCISSYALDPLLAAIAAHVEAEVARRTSALRRDLDEARGLRHVVCDRCGDPIQVYAPGRVGCPCFEAEVARRMAAAPDVEQWLGGIVSRALRGCSGNGARADLMRETDALRTAIARAISDATAAATESLKNGMRRVFKCSAHNVDPTKAWGCPDCLAELRRATAARETVGGLLATGTVRELLGGVTVVEWHAAPDWYQARIAQRATGTVAGAELRWRHESARNWSSWGQPWGWASQHMDQPARLVPAAEADADPSQRGPLPKGG